MQTGASQYTSMLDRGKQYPSQDGFIVDCEEKVESEVTGEVDEFCAGRDIVFSAGGKRRSELLLRVEM